MVTYRMWVPNRKGRADLHFTSHSGGPLMSHYFAFCLKSIFCVLMFTSGNATGQVAKLLEPCGSSIKCDSGLQCIELRSGKSACSKCSESEHNSKSREVDEACKSFGEGWAFESNRAYAESTASDGRVDNAAFDVLYEQSQKCRAAREQREGSCWGGGDEEHRKAIDRINVSMDRIKDHRARMAQNKRLFYTDRSTYQNRLSTYEDKCMRLDFNNLRQTVDAARVAMDRTEKVDCSALEQVASKSMECFQAAKSLREDGFRNTSDRIPDEVVKASEQSGKSSKSHPVVEVLHETRTCVANRYCTTPTPTTVE